jgi:glycine cleavage system H protein
LASPSELRYTEEHEWVRVEDGIGTIGITDYAQDQLGDVVFVDLPAVGTQVVAGQRFGEIESVKAVSELVSPVSAEVVEANDTLSEKPEQVNDSPYGDGWMIRVRVSDPEALDKLLGPEEYDTYVAGIAE